MFTRSPYGSYNDILKQWASERRTNPYWPLPPEYGLPQTHYDDRKRMRVELVCDHRTPLHFMRAWDAFCNFYLRPKDTGFYFSYRKPGPMHYAAVYDFARYPFNAIAWPRGAGKSVTIVRSLPTFLACTRPRIQITLVASTEKRAEEVLRGVKDQIAMNKYIHEDFGKLKAKNAEGGFWTAKGFRLRNLFKMLGTAIGSMNLGDRPNVLLLDDVEHDPADPDSGPKLTEQLETKLFDTYMPMMQEGTSMFMLGTIRPRRSTMLGRILKSKDPRFAEWNRRSVSIYNPVRGIQFPCWSEKWPPRIIRAIQKRQGASFYSEYMNVNRSDRPLAFKYDQTFHTYKLTKLDAAWDKDPFESTAEMHYCLRPKPGESVTQVVKIPIRQYLPEWVRLITVDYARTVNAHSDYSCVEVSALAHNRKLIFLDMWHGRATRDKVIQAVIAMTLKWRPRLIGSESFSVEQETTDILQKELRDTCESIMGFVPQVIPLGSKTGVGVVRNSGSKSDRAATLGWRFERDAILLPGERSFDPPWRFLFDQIINFNGNMADLSNDDALDTAAMTTPLLKLFLNPEITAEERPSELQELINEGSHQAIGVPLLSTIDPRTLPLSELQRLREASKPHPHGVIPAVRYADDPSESELESAWDFSQLKGLTQCGGVFTFVQPPAPVDPDTVDT